MTTRLATSPTADSGIFGVLLATRGPKGKWEAVLALVRQLIGWFLEGLLLVQAVTLPGLGVTTGFPIEGQGWKRIYERS